MKYLAGVSATLDADPDVNIGEPRWSRGQNSEVAGNRATIKITSMPAIRYSIVTCWF